MDGLFLDSEPQWHEAETQMMRENGYDWKPEDQLHCLGGPLRRVAEYMSNCLQGRKSPTELEAMIIAEINEHMEQIATAARARADAVLLSPVFATRSHPGGRALGPLRFLMLARQSPLPVIALGGMTRQRAARLSSAARTI